MGGCLDQDWEGWEPIVSKLYDYSVRIQDEIRTKGLDVYKTRGKIAMKTGFLITLLSPDEPDDAARVEALRDAALEVLGIKLD